MSNKDILHNKSLVSVLIPFYKGDDYIEGSIISVKNQTYQNVELIVINDSPQSEKSTIFIKELQKKYNFALINNDHNSGLTRSFINGFKESKGKYICFLAQDDLFIENKIESQLEFFNKNDKCLCLYTDMEFWYENQGKREVPNVSNTIKKIKEKNIFPSLYFGNLPGLYVQSMMVKRELVARDIAPVWSRSKADGWPVHITLFEKYQDNIFFIEEALVSYRIHSSNTIHDHKKMFSLILPTILEFCPEENQQEVISNHLHLLGCKGVGNINITKVLLRKILNLFIVFFSRKFRKKIRKRLKEF